jgi:hypothetical protein
MCPKPHPSSAAKSKFAITLGALLAFSAPMAMAGDAVSLNFHSGTDNLVTGSYGAEVLGSVVENWTNLNDLVSGTNLIDGSGVATTVDFSSTGFNQFTGVYPSSWDYNGSLRYDLSPFKSGPPTTSSGAPIELTLSDLNANFPGGYKVVAFLTGQLENQGASLSDGATTFYYRNASLRGEDLVANGGFESGSGSGTTRSFDVTDTWYNRGTGSDQTNNARRTNTDTGSAYVGQIVDRYNGTTAASDFDSAAFGTITHSQKTTYTITAGDQFSLSYVWQDAFNWNDGLDQVRVVLFATSDNTLGGTVLWSSVMDSGFSTQNLTYEAVNALSSVVNGAAVGQSLFINVFGFQNSGGLSANTGFARIDDIQVDVYSRVGPNQKVSTDLTDSDGIDEGNLVIFGSDVSPLTDDSLTLTLSALTEGAASIGGLQILPANPNAGRTSLLSCSLYSRAFTTEVIEFGKAFGFDGEDFPGNASWWNNIRYTIDIGPIGIPLRYSNGVPSAVIVTPTDSDADGEYDSTWGSDQSFSATWNDTVLKAGRTTFATATPVQYDLNNLIESFPFGYRVIVYLSGYAGNDMASISNGATTYYFEIGTPEATATRSTLTVEPTVVDTEFTDNVPDAEYVVFGSAETPLIDDTLTLTLTTLGKESGVAIAGFQIVGNELDVDIAEIVGNTLTLSVGGIPAGLTLEVQDSTDLAAGFAPLSAVVTIDSTTAQPISITIDTDAQPNRFFGISPVTAP